MTWQWLLLKNGNLNPWKGQIWKGVGKDNTNRVWTGPVHFDLVWSGTDWLPYKTPQSASVDPCAVEFNFPTAVMSEVIVGWDGKAVLIAKETGERTAPIKKPKTLYGASRLQAEKELNAAYVLYEKDPEYKETFYLKLYAYVRSTRSNASYVKLVNRAEMYIDAGDILGAFLLKITSLIENGKYTHEGKMENWLGFHWGNYHFPEVQTEIKSYLDRSIYVNQTAVGRGGDDNEDKNFEHQNHSVAIKNVQEEQVEREQHKGYFFPVSRDRLFREMNPITQDIVRMLCEGLSITEIAARVNISPRHIRRVATEEGEDALNNVLSTLQACADEDNVLPWPCGVGEIQASAEDVFEPLLGVPEAAKLLRIHPKTLQPSQGLGAYPASEWENIGALENLLLMLGWRSN